MYSINALLDYRYKGEQKKWNKKIINLGFYEQNSDHPKGDLAQYKDNPPLPEIMSFDILFVSIETYIEDKETRSKRSNVTYGKAVKTVVNQLHKKYKSSFVNGELLFPTLLDAGDTPTCAINYCMSISQKVSDLYVLMERMFKPFSSLYGDPDVVHQHFNWKKRSRESNKSTNVQSAEHDLLDYLAHLRSFDCSKPISYKAVQELTGISRQKLSEYIRRTQGETRNKHKGLSVQDLDEQTKHEINKLVIKYNMAKQETNDQTESTYD